MLSWGLPCKWVTFVAPKPTCLEEFFVYHIGKGADYDQIERVLLTFWYVSVASATYWYMTCPA